MRDAPPRRRRRQGWRGAAAGGLLLCCARGAEAQFLRGGFSAAFGGGAAAGGGAGGDDDALPAGWCAPAPAATAPAARDALASIRRCKNTAQGKRFVADDAGRACEWTGTDGKGCCATPLEACATCDEARRSVALGFAVVSLPARSRATCPAAL